MGADFNAMCLTKVEEAKGVSIQQGKLAFTLCTVFEEASQSFHKLGL